MRRALLALFIFSQSCLYAQTHVKEINTILERQDKKALNLTLLSVAKEFLGKPYVGGTLEKTPESLVFNLSQLDCYTLVENVLAISLAKHSPKPNFETYKNYLQRLRYRDGKIDGYGSRMHYFTDWAYQAESNNILDNLTSLFGVKQDKTIDFMTSNRGLYKSLSKNDSLTKVIAVSENLLNKKTFYFIPKEDFEKMKNKINEGDIIAFTSQVKGLDVNHEGFAIRVNGNLHLLHASLDEKKVVISKETLAQYLSRIKKHSGIMVFRVKG